MQSGARAEQRLRTGAQKGDTKSGDNDALKYLVREMDKSTRARRVAYPPQCALNSYLWRVSMRQWWRWLTAGSKIRSGIWRPGHLLVHLAGWNNYQVWLEHRCHRAGAGAARTGPRRCVKGWLGNVPCRRCCVAVHVGTPWCGIYKARAALELSRGATPSVVT